ncbi:hypothetical protein [Sulfurimonas sp. HSL3-7]|uniref:hypothetical protein n=1 Tax=Sulfonitrofixus jiaomeiensis TaxID=3131938 RepID=UPI0031F81FE6
MNLVLFIHILSATAWIGGALLLFALGIFLRDKQAQSNVYDHLGPIYGYFESFWLVTLLTTGSYMFIHHGIGEVLLYAPGSQLGQNMLHKLYAVGLIALFTVVHMVIAFKVHKSTRTTFQNILMRGSSLLIFILNIVILWYAIRIRSLL